MRAVPSHLLALGAAWLLGCGVVSEDATEGGGAAAALVEVAQTRAGVLVDSATLLGDVRSLATAELASGAPGPVDQVRVRPGDAVRRGDLLVEVDPSLAAARLTSARAAVQAAEVEHGQAARDLARMERVESAVLAPSELERQRASVAGLEAQAASLAATARLSAVELERHRVRAPFDGVVIARHVDPGDWVTVGQPAVDLVSSEGVEVHVQAPLALARSVQVGDVATLHASPDVRSEVVGVVPVLDPVQRTTLVRLAPRDEVTLLPGMPVDVSFSVPRSDPQAVLLPRDALILGASSTRVAAVDDDVVRVVRVEVLATSGETALVKGDGLSEGQQVVVRGNERLRPGQSVKVVDTRAWTAAD